MTHKMKYRLQFKTKDLVTERDMKLNSKEINIIYSVIDTFRFHEAALNEDTQVSLKCIELIK